MPETSQSSIPEDPFELFDGEPAPSPLPQGFGPDRLSALAAERLGRDLKVNFLDPVVTLSARQPYDPSGARLDIIRAARWNTANDLIHMEPITATPGKPPASLGYLMFTPKESRLHLISVSFSGTNSSLRIASPFGEATAHAATASQPTAVFAFWNLTAGKALATFLSCTGPNMAYIQQINVL